MVVATACLVLATKGDRENGLRVPVLAGDRAKLVCPKVSPCPWPPPCVLWSRAKQPEVRGPRADAAAGPPWGRAPLREQDAAPRGGSSPGPKSRGTGRGKPEIAAPHAAHTPNGAAVEIISGEAIKEGN